MNRKESSDLSLTHRALRDIQDIFDYSVDRWGKQVAEKYLDAIEAALERLQEHPALLKSEPDFHASLKFYQINKHLLVCDTRSRSIVVLTVIHGGMDISARLADLQPTLATEIELLHRKYQARDSKKRNE